MTSLLRLTMVKLVSDQSLESALKFLSALFWANQKWQSHNYSLNKVTKQLCKANSIVTLQKCLPVNTFKVSLQLSLSTIFKSLTKQSQRERFRSNYKNISKIYSKSGNMFKLEKYLWSMTKSTIWTLSPPSSEFLILIWMMIEWPTAEMANKPLT